MVHHLCDDHLPHVAPDFVSADCIAKTSVGEGLVIGMFAHPSLASVRKPSEQAALTADMLVPQTLVEMQNILTERMEV